MRRIRGGLVLLALSLPVGCGSVDYPPTPEGYYLAKCARCHEPDGSSITASEQADKAIDLRTPRFQRHVSDDEIFTIVWQGKGRMMAVTGLDSAQVDSVVLHVRRLGRAHASALDSARTGE